MTLIDMHSHWGTRRGYPFQTAEELAQRSTQLSARLDAVRANIVLHDRLAAAERRLEALSAGRDALEVAQLAPGRAGRAPAHAVPAARAGVTYPRTASMPTGSRRVS